LCHPPKRGGGWGGKKAQGPRGGAFLAWALEAFSGYAAVDERYEDPYGVRSAVDNRQYKRMLYAVLDHDPDHDDIEAFRGRLTRALAERALARTGSTTDGAALYPAPIRTVFGDVPHQLCPFHVIKELPPGVLTAVATERQRLATSKPTLKRGSPSSNDKAARRLARTRNAMQQKISALLQDRLVFVKRRRTRSERKRLLHITRGLPHLRKRRDLMDHMSVLLDRRCRTQTARGKLKKLRHWVNRGPWIGETFKKVHIPVA
jgi:hypothetical protein